MREDQELISVPGFGFYSEEEWRVFGPMRRSENGNHSDAEVCQMIGYFWESTVEDRESFCPPQWDGVAACIPAAPRNEIAVLPCIPFWDNEYYDTSYNITKQCLENGRWANYTNYEDCLNHQIAPPMDPAGPVTEWEVLIFLLGYSVSIISLLFAIFIFMYFREMRCLRHKIHLNLFLSVLTANLDWVITYAVTHFMIYYRDDQETLTSLSTVNCILHVLLRYFHLTNFFWMFTEGLYLFLQVQASFSVGRLKLRHCVSIGWGAPLLLTLLWTLLIYCQTQTEVYNSQANGRHSINVSDLGGCPFMVESAAARNYELYSYTIPICFLLASNFFFAIWILAIVYSKLRGNNDAHLPTPTQNINLRALKAFIIIVPLLGITYLVTIVGPQKTTTTFATIFIFTRNVSVSFTGFFITLPYCYFNSEVCAMIKSHWDRWRDRNNIGYGPASRANSIALQGMYNVNEARKRSSYGYHTVTTVTTVGDDRSRHGTAETTEVVTAGQQGHAASKQNGGSPSHHQQISWKTYDGPLVPKPDLVQHSQNVDSREADKRDEDK